ncbi:MAG: polysaccharide deacetylase family protein [Fischerella sp.]|nr:polysaccharide deacetylase family protein [Fischerella sp.]
MTCKFLNVQKNKKYPLLLAIIFIIIVSFIIFTDTATVIPIVGFHGIIDSHKNYANQSDIKGLHYPKQNLEDFLEYLVINDYQFLTTQDLYDFFLRKSGNVPKEFFKKKLIMISFDDGYKSVHTDLLPILYKLEKKYGKKVKVVLFINPGNLSDQKNSDSTHLECEELREGFAQGFYDIQSHGFNHIDLTRLTPRRLIYEILKSQIALRECTKDLDPEQKVANHFAYPYGAYNQRVRYYVSKYYLSSYLYNNQILNTTFLKNYYEIPRLTVNQQESVQALIEKFESTEYNQEKAALPANWKP